MGRLLTILVFPFLLLLAVGCSPQEKAEEKEKHVLKINFPPGAKYQYTSTQRQDISSMGIANIEQSMVTEFRYEMLTNDPEQTQLSVLFKHATFKSMSPAGEMSYDSDSPDSSALFKDLDQFVGQTYVVNFTALGGIKDIVHQSSDPRRKQENDSKNPGKMINDTTFALVVKNNFDVYPGKPVSIGETWKSTSETNLANFKLVIKSAYTLRSIEDGIARIDLVSDLHLPESTMSADGYQLQVKMDGKQTGFIHMRVETGEIIYDEVQQKVDAKIHSMGQELPMIINSEIKGVGKKI